MATIPRLGRILPGTLLVFLLATACSGGGGGTSSNSGGSPAEPPPDAASTRVTVTLALNGTLPPQTAIAGVAFTLRFPGIPAGTASAAVTPAGILRNGLLLPPVYTAAGNGGSLQVVLADTTAGGLRATGPVAAVSLVMPGTTVPPPERFAVENGTVVDLLGNAVAGAGIVVSAVNGQPSP